MLLKAGSKRRRTKVEIADAKLEEEKREERQYKNEQKIKDMMNELQKERADAKIYKDGAAKLNDLLQSGALRVDEQGNVIVNQQR